MIKEEELSKQMEEALDQKYIVFGGVVTAWEELETAKNKVRGIEAIIKLELKVADPKMTVDMMNCKVNTDKRMDVAIASEITAEANYKLAQGEYENLADRFKKLNTDAYLMGKVNI